MMKKSADIRRTVHEFRREKDLYEVSHRTLQSVFESFGFTVIEFNPVVNDPDVSALIHALNLSDLTAHANGFLVMNEQFRLLFINEKLSGEEKKLVMAHELGHYVLGHVSHQPVIGQDVDEEFEANEFAHYLLQPRWRDRVKERLYPYRLWIAGTIILAAVLLAGLSAFRQYRIRQLYEEEYYVTAVGTKYHRAGCVTIEGHKVRRLTKRDVESGNYEPCGVCLSQE